MYRLILILACSTCMAFGGNLSLEEALSANKTDQKFTLTSGATLSGFEKTYLTPSVASYRFQLQVGPGEHDVVGIHRVVRERRGWPAPDSRALFLVHGDLFAFDPLFLAGFHNDAVPESQSYALYMAEAGMDVWGIDRRWTQIPADTTNFDFLTSWDMGTEVNDIRKAMTVARTLRLLTTGRPDGFFLQGWSSGGALAFAVANEETKVPRFARNVKGLIPTDIFYSLPAGVEVEASQRACARLEVLRAELADGQTWWNNGDFDIFVELFQQAPDEPSPIFRGYTNRQAFLGIGALSFLLDGDTPFTPAYHFVAGTYDDDFMPLGLAYTDPNAYAGILMNLSPFQDKGTRLGMEEIVCGDSEASFANRLDRVQVPVFYVGAAGGFGYLGAQTLQLFENNQDVTSYVVQKQPEGYEVLDYGHLDLFLATDAPDQVWSPILEWLEQH